MYVYSGFGIGEERFFDCDTIKKTVFSSCEYEKNVQGPFQITIQVNYVFQLEPILDTLYPINGMLCINIVAAQRKSKDTTANVAHILLSSASRSGTSPMRTRFDDRFAARSRYGVECGVVLCADD